MRLFGRGRGDELSRGKGVGGNGGIPNEVGTCLVNT